MSLTPEDDPFERFRQWLAEAEETEPNDPSAMALATVGADGMPSVRMVLLKTIDERGFAFFTNLGSRKAKELEATGKAALCIHWKTRRRQVRVEGTVERVGDEEADKYFATRARVSRIGAWASKQSEPMEGRWELEKRVALYTAKYAVGDIPRPDFWSGFRIIPRAIEFWEDREFRLHDRIVYHRADDGTWKATRLYP